MAPARKLLLITPAYPPVFSPATHRPLKLARYLGEVGIRPFVLTVAPSPDAALDESLLSQVAHVPCTRVRLRLDLAGLGRRIARANWVSRDGDVRAPRPRGRAMRFLLGVRDLMMFPDHMGTAVPALYKAAVAIIRREGIDAVYTTGPHHSVHLVGRRLKRRLRVPCWIAEFRDAWVSDPKMVLPSRVHRWANRRWERSVVRTADAVVCVTQYMRDDFVARYPDLPPGKYHVIYNGFDEADFVDVQPLSHRDGRIHIAHTGTIYERAGAHRVLECLGQVVRDQPDIAQRLRLDLVGQVHPAAWQALQQQIDASRLDDVVRFHGSLPHRQAIAHMLAADWLLLMTGPGREVVTTKVFEYMRSGRPILAVCEPDAEVRRILANANAPYLAVDRNRPEQVTAALRHVLDGAGAPPAGPAGPARGLSTFCRQAAAREVAELIRRVLAGKRGKRPS